MYPCRDILEATYCISVGKFSGTAFCVEKDGRLYFVTAKHMICDYRDETVATDIDDFCVISRSDGRQMRLTNVHVLLGAAGVDVSVLAVPKADDLCAVSYSQLSAKGMILGEPVFLVGFPFVMAQGYMTKDPDANRMFYLPAIKAGVVSTFEDVDGKTFLVDAYNNSGFSGGPVVMKCGNGGSVVCGTLCGFKNDQYTNMPNGVINSGFTIVCPIAHAIELIDKCASVSAPNAWIC